MTKSKKAKQKSGELRIEYVPLEDLEGWPRNPKRHDIKEISNSMSDFGYVSPVIIDETTSKIAAGHGRIDSLKVLRGQGKEPPERIQVIDGQWHVPVVRGIHFKSEQDVERFLIADNYLTEKGGWDSKALAELLSEFVSEDEKLLKGLGVGIKEYDALVASLEAPVKPLNLAGGNKPKTMFEHTCPRCGFKFQTEGKNGQT